MKVNEVSDGVYAMSSSHRSTAQDLGGMNDFIAVDTNANKVYSMTSDGHDMMGMGFPEGNDLLNVLPIEVFGLGSGKSQRVKKQEVVGDPDISVSLLNGGLRVECLSQALSTKQEQYVT